MFTHVADVFEAVLCWNIINNILPAAVSFMNDKSGQMELDCDTTDELMTSLRKLKEKQILVNWNNFSHVIFTLFYA